MEAAVLSLWWIGPMSLKIGDILMNAIDHHLMFYFVGEKLLIQSVPLR